MADKPLFCWVMFGGLHTEHIQTKKTTDKNQSLVEQFLRSEADSKVEPQARPREDPLLAQVG